VSDPPVSEHETDPPADPALGLSALRPRSTGSSVLAAAMLGMGQVLEPEKTQVQIEIEAPGDPDDQPFDLDFGALPPLT
jgi:hypothetical protein